MQGTSTLGVRNRCLSALAAFCPFTKAFQSSGSPETRTDMLKTHILRLIVSRFEVRRRQDVQGCRLGVKAPCAVYLPHQLLLAHLNRQTETR